LRNSEERYRVLYENNPTMYFTLNPDGTVLSVNNFGAHELGYQPHELIGKSVGTVIYEEDRQVVAQHIAECVRSPRRLAKWEFRKVRKDGSLLWVKEVGCALRDPQDRLMILVVCEDITARKQAEKALQQAYEELEWHVKERTAELAQANLELTVEIQERERVVEALRASEARLAKTQGTCTLWLIVDAAGNPRDIRVVRGLGHGLDAKAMEAVNRWHFDPALKDGKPVNVQISVEVEFKLY